MENSDSANLGDSDHANETRNRKSLLRHELYGQPAPTSKPDAESGIVVEGLSPGGSIRLSPNFLKFSSPNNRRSSPGSGFSVLETVQTAFVAPSSATNQRIQNSPKKLTRKIARVPYKV